MWFEPLRLQSVFAELEQRCRVEYKFGLDQGSAWSGYHYLLIDASLFHLNFPYFLYKFKINIKHSDITQQIQLDSSLQQVNCILCFHKIHTTPHKRLLFFDLYKGKYLQNDCNIINDRGSSLHISFLSNDNYVCAWECRSMIVPRQQNYMSVIVKDKQINYNQSQFYRANPYVNQGYIPTSSLKNRKQPQFITEIPQGINYFEPSAKKHFTQITRKSAIAEGNLLTNPEKYPYENRIASDINFHRNLNTIDIEGTNASSKKSKAMKNRIKAQEELKRRNARIITPILWEGLSEDQIRRKLAEQQRERANSRDRQSNGLTRKYNSESKLPPAEIYARSPYREMKDEGMQSNLETLEKYLTQRQKEEQNQANLYQQTQKKNIKNTNQQNKRYQSQQNINKLIQGKLITNDLQYQIQSNGSGLVHPQSAASTNLNNQIRQYFQKEIMNKQKDLISQQYKQQFRQLNPTNLSYQGAIVKNSSIFSTLGRNLALN